MFLADTYIDSPDRVDPKSEGLFDISSYTGARSCTHSVTTNYFFGRCKESVVLSLGLSKESLSRWSLNKPILSFLRPYLGMIFLILMSIVFLTQNSTILR